MLWFKKAPIVTTVTKVRSPEEEVARYHAMIAKMETYRAHDTIAQTAQRNDAEWRGRQAR